jgi:hypothetical protein
MDDVRGVTSRHLLDVFKILHRLGEFGVFEHSMIDTVLESFGLCNPIAFGWWCAAMGCGHDVTWMTTM